jgi:hypothetical protein
MKTPAPVGRGVGARGTSNDGQETKPLPDLLKPLRCPQLRCWLPRILLVYSEYNRFQDEIQSIRTQFIESQKELIQTEVQEVIDYVRYMRSRTGERARAAIRERVYEAHNLASPLYGLYHGRLPDPEIKRLIVEALRPVRFNNGRGYYFATSLDGVEQLFADRPELENTNILDMRDTNGKYAVRDMIAIARTKGEGFYEYTWTKPGQAGRGFPKIAFVKYFKPFDMLFGPRVLDDKMVVLRGETLDGSPRPLRQ